MACALCLLPSALCLLPSALCLLPSASCLQDASLEKQAALEAGQAAALRMLGEAEGHLGGLFQLVEGRAAELAAAAGPQAEAQRALAGELGSLADSSKGIRSAVDVVLGYQQRSDSGGWIG